MTHKGLTRLANSFLPDEALLLDAILKKCLTVNDMAVLRRNPAFSSLLGKATRMARKVPTAVAFRALGSREVTRSVCSECGDAPCRCFVVVP